MSIFQDDIEELRRLATNTYENDMVQQIHRIIQGINQLVGEVQTLKVEKEVLLSRIKDLESKSKKD